MSMTKDEALARLCKLVTRVGSEVYLSVHAHDCFCGHEPHPDQFRIDEQVMAFVEAAVYKAVNERLESDKEIERRTGFRRCHHSLSCTLRWGHPGACMSESTS